MFQEQDATKERLINAGADYERQEEQYNNEIDRLQEKLNKVEGHPVQNGKNAGGDDNIAILHKCVL